MCDPSGLRLAVGTSVIVAGVTGQPELNDRTGVIVKELDEKRGRYGVRLDGRKTLAGLRPENCLAAVRGSGAVWTANGSVRASA
jgi:hypothetical protein